MQILIHCWYECKMAQLIWKIIFKLLIKLRPYNLAVSLLSIYHREIKTHGHLTSYTQMFIAVISYSPKIGITLMSRTSERIKKLWSIHTM